jgi:hypothetical protein
VVLLTLGVLPGGLGFVAIYMGGVGLRASGEAAALILLAVVVLVNVLAALSRLRRIEGWPRGVASAWAAALLLIAGLPAVLLSPVVLPAAGTVRTLPAGTVTPSLLGLTVDGVAWPALLATAVLAAALIALWRTGAIIPEWRIHLALPALPRLRRPRAPAIPARWTTRITWVAFLLVVSLAVLRA